MQTRYYDPEVGRFISQDSVEYADPETINGINLYAYCNNDPINYLDPTGNAKWWQWLLFGIGAAITAAAIVVLSVASGGTVTGLFGAIAVGAAKGALIGAAVGTVAGIAGGAVYAGVTGADMGQSILSGFLMGFGIGAIVGAVVGGVAGGIQFNHAASYWGATETRTPAQNMVHHFKKHVVNEGHKYLGKNEVEYTKNALKLFKNNQDLLKLTKSGNYAIRTIINGKKVGGFFNLVGKIFSFF